MVRDIPRNYTLTQAKADAESALREQLRQDGVDDIPVETVEADLFATLDDAGRGSKDIRVVCQILPGIAEQAVMPDMVE